MRQSIRLGRFAGIPVGLHWSAAVIAALITGVLRAQVLPTMVPHQRATAYWVAAAGVAVLFVAALLAHELAHAIVARRAGVPAASITLWALGGMAELTGEPPDARADLRIAAAGPAASLAAAAAFGCLALLAGITRNPSLAAASLAWLAFMNAALAVFNLLPGAPLDGGRVLRALLWMRGGDRYRAGLAAARAGRLVGIGLAALGVADALAFRDAGGLWLTVIGVFMISAANAEAHAQATMGALAGLRVRDVMTASPVSGAGSMCVSDFIEHVAMRSAQSVFPVTGSDGGLIGVVILKRLSLIPLPDRRGITLRQAAAVVPPAYLARPDDPAASLLTRPPLAGILAAVVISDGAVVGLVTMEALRQMIWRAQVHLQPLREMFKEKKGAS